MKAASTYLEDFSFYRYRLAIVQLPMQASTSFLAASGH